MKTRKAQAGFWDIAGPIIGSFIGGERRNETQLASAREANEFSAAQAELDREFQAEQAEIARGFNSAEAKRNRLFQWRTFNHAQAFDRTMSNTAVRRRMQDLRRGGINPILAGRYDASSPSASALSGSTASASAPGGASASGQQARIEDSISGAVHSGLDAQRTKHAAALMKEEAKTQMAVEARTRSEKGKVEAETDVSKSHRANLDADSNVKRAQEREIHERIAEIRTNTALNIAKHGREEAETERTRRDWDTPKTVQDRNRQETIHSAAQARRETAQAQHSELDLERAKTDERIEKSAYGRGLRWASRLGGAANSALAAGTLAGIGKKFIKAISGAKR